MSNDIRIIKNIYIKTNENNVKKIKKGWIGINNVPKLFFIKSNDNTVKILPDGYKRVEYILHNGLNDIYINTGVLGFKPIDLSFSIIERDDKNSTGTCITGAYEIRHTLVGSNPPYTNGDYSWGINGYQTPEGCKTHIKIGFFHPSVLSQTFDCEFNIKNTLTIISKTSLDKFHSIFNKTQSKKYLYNNNINDMNKYLLSSQSLYRNNCGYILIFDGPYMSTAQTSSSSGTSIKLYTYKMYSDPTRQSLIRNFIPCIEEETDTPGLYDLVNNNFYGNSNPNTSSIKFLAGPEV